MHSAHSLLDKENSIESISQEHREIWELIERLLQDGDADKDVARARKESVLRSN